MQTLNAIVKISVCIGTAQVNGDGWISLGADISAIFDEKRKFCVVYVNICQ